MPRITPTFVSVAKLCNTFTSSMKLFDNMEKSGFHEDCQVVNKQKIMKTVMFCMPACNNGVVYVNTKT